MIEFICNYLVTQGVNPAAAGFLARGIVTVLAIVLSSIANFFNPTDPSALLKTRSGQLNYF